MADQQGASFEHIIMDGGSGDGTIEWLQQNSLVTAIVQKDNGMYDAVNKGLVLAKGKILSYLNCDEQYLPGTLSFVKKYLAEHPRADILLGDTLLVKPDGSLISFRKGYQPRWFYILSSHLYVLSCTMFFRRKIVTDGFRFDARLKDVGDQDFVVRVLRHGHRAGHARRYFAAFTMTGTNRSFGQNAWLERTRAIAAAPQWVKLLRVPLNAARLAEKLLSGAYWQRMPLEYSIYVTDGAATRKPFKIPQASFRWPDKTQA